MTTFDFNNMCKLGLDVYVSRPTFTVFLTHHELYQAWLYGRILGNYPWSWAKNTGARRISSESD